MIRSVCNAQVREDRGGVARRFKGRQFNGKGSDLANFISMLPTRFLCLMWENFTALAELSCFLNLITMYFITNSLTKESLTRDQSISPLAIICSILLTISLDY